MDMMDIVMCVITIGGLTGIYGNLNRNFEHLKKIDKNLDEIRRATKHLGDG